MTFTEAAAAELKSRLRGALMALGRVDDALAIDRAYVGTIHGLGLRLLTEHAFATGRSPALRLLTEAERDLLIRREAGRSPALEPVLSDLARHGYAWDRVSGRNAEEQFRARVLATVDLLRGLGARGMDPALTEAAEGAVRTLYGACIEDATDGDGCLGRRGPGADGGLPIRHRRSGCKSDRREGIPQGFQGTESRFSRTGRAWA